MRGAGGFIIPVGKENLRFTITGPSAGPAEFGSVRRKNGESVEPPCECHPDRLVFAVNIDNEQLEIFETELVRRKDEILAARMIERRPGHRLEIRELLFVRAVEVHRPNVGNRAVFLEMSPDDSFAIRREERAAVVAGSIG